MIESLNRFDHKKSQPPSGNNHNPERDMIGPHNYSYTVVVWISTDMDAHMVLLQ